MALLLIFLTAKAKRPDREEPTPTANEPEVLGMKSRSVLAFCNYINAWRPCKWYCMEVHIMVQLKSVWGDIFDSSSLPAVSGTSFSSPTALTAV
jgi:hypothetical protein